MLRPSPGQECCKDTCKAAAWASPSAGPTVDCAQNRPTRGIAIANQNKLGAGRRHAWDDTRREPRTP
eukprot:2039774-Pyramimonas_sp.AAC.1